MSDTPTKQDGDARRGRRATINTPEMVDLACRLWGFATKGQIKRAIRRRTGASARTCERIFQFARERLAEEGNQPRRHLDPDMLASLQEAIYSREADAGVSPKAKALDRLLAISLTMDAADARAAAAASGGRRVGVAAEAGLPRLRRRGETEQPDRPDPSAAAAAVPTVAAAVAELRPVAEAIGLAALDDATLAALAELLTEAEAVASRWLTARDPHLAGQDKQRRRRAQRTT